MKIGTLKFEIFGELNYNNSVEHFISTMDQILLSVSYSFDSDYRRFSFYAAVINIEVPLKTFWRNDFIYNSIINSLNYDFTNWQIKLFLDIHERSK